MPTILIQKKTTKQSADPAYRRVPSLGLELDPLTTRDAVKEIGNAIEIGSPTYVITPNLNYAMLCDQDPTLASVNREALLMLADGMPLVWASRGQLPERVAGSDLIPQLCAQAARMGWRVFLCGGAPGVAEEAARNLLQTHPDLRISGTAAPVFNPDQPLPQDFLDQVKASRSHLLLVAASQPKGELWLHRHHRELGVPVAVQMGATIDFLAKRVTRAPAWIKKTGLEWLWRLAMEPRRLAWRYWRNSVFLAKAVLFGTKGGKQP